MSLRMSAKKGEAIELPIVRSIADLRSAIALRRAAGESIGLVPTMGALHEGHLALVRASCSGMDCTVATVLVNPLQFSPDEDFESYPRNEAGDAAMLSEAGADLLYAPAIEEIYPEGFSTKVEVTGLTDVLCGAFRPVHFSGVATVVTKLFLQALPDAAFFGEKDYQQVLVVRRLVRDLDIPIHIEMVPTVREADGLALSSRNAYLTAEERAVAPKLYATLNEMAMAIRKGNAIAETIAIGEAALREAGFRSIDYLDVRDPETLARVEVSGRPARIFAAVHLGKARLIDNLAIPG
ncbi:MAG: pantoate--beta-alanine ligase [Alphaproteobacteria bacterium]|nr:pantoate--beta-alanine ligase [Alphaproteobacteria bacterium]